MIRIIKLLFINKIYYILYNVVFLYPRTLGGSPFRVGIREEKDSGSDFGMGLWSITNSGIGGGHNTFRYPIPIPIPISDTMLCNQSL